MTTTDLTTNHVRLIRQKALFGGQVSRILVADLCARILQDERQLRAVEDLATEADAGGDHATAARIRSALRLEDVAPASTPAEQRDGPFAGDPA